MKFLIDFELTFIDLFCGIGGFHTALKRNGCKCVLACDIDKHCRDVYELNHNIKPKSDIRDIKEEDIPNFDILCAGFPCQSFSHSGKQKGFEDETRGTLFFDICRILKAKNPSYFILENVKNLYSHNKGKTWKIIYSSLIELGYSTYEKPITASPRHFGIPQNRDRLFIVGIRNDKKLSKLTDFPVYKKQETNIETILEKDENIPNELLKKVSLTEEQISLLNLWEEFIQYFKSKNIKLPTFPIWSLELDLIYCLEEIPKWKEKIIISNRKFYKDNKKFIKKWLIKARSNDNFVGSKAKLEWQCGKYTSSDSIWTLLFQYRPSGIRISRANYSPALVAMSQIVYIGSKKRKLTPRETARLQSFPDDFVIHTNTNQAYKQFGNSVNVEVVENILYHLLS
jgi:DNA (cytosine-5)-methyltransferase 1